MTIGFARVRSIARALSPIVFMLGIALPAAASAQSSAAVTGTVQSPDGAPIAAASITLAGAKGTYRAVSDARGAFSIASIPAGTYEAYITAPGYATLSQRAVSVAPGGTLSFVLTRATVNSLTVIGTVESSAGASVPTTSGTSVTYNAQTAAARATTATSDIVWNALSATPVLPLGGGSNAPVSIALRGPDPSETLVDIDGHPANNGNTGDFDLSLIDPAALQDVQVIYGISPASLLGPNTLGGAVNLVTLQPTTVPQTLVRGFAGSFGTTGQTLQTTGTAGRFGYVFSAHRATSLGSVNQTVDDQTTDSPATVGSAFFNESLLSKLRYSFGGGYGYVQLNVRDSAAYKDLSSLLTTFTPPNFSGEGDDAVVRPNDGETSGGFAAFPGTSLSSHQANYGFDAFMPIGRQESGVPPATTLTYSHLTTLASQSVVGPGAQTSPYLYNQRDLVGDDWLLLEHHWNTSDLSLKYDVSTENLNTQYVPGATHADLVPAPALMPFDNNDSQPTSLGLSQTQRSAVLRYQANPTPQLHYSTAIYYSNFSLFGSSLNPRSGITWTPTARSAVRFSLGSTFQTPQLTAMYVPPVLPLPVGGIVSVGNPNLKPDYATEYDLGTDQVFGRPDRALRLSVDLYRTNLRNATQILVPAPVPHCSKHQPPDCPLSYPINAGNGVYTGIDVHAEQQLARGFKLRAGWDVDSSYLTGVPPSVQDGTLVVGEQSLGQPLHKAYFGFERDVPRGLVYGADLNYEGAYNELNRGPYATLAAHLAYRLPHLELGVYGTNLTNVYGQPFTTVGGGILYGTVPGNPMIPTDAYVLQGPRVVFVVTSRM